MKPTIFVLGKLPPPYMGPAIATKIILNSKLKDKYNLVHISTQVNSSFKTQGKASFSKIWKNLSLYINLWKQAKKYRPEIMLFPFSQQTMGFLKDVPYILIAKHFNIKVAMQLRGSNFKTWLTQSSRLTNYIVRKTLLKTEAMIVLGDKLRYLFDGYYPSDKIFVVPNGGDFCIPIRQKKPNNKINITYIGNYLPSKGFDVILDALSILPNHVKNQIHLTAIGGWQGEDYKNKCEQIIDKEQLPVSLFEQTESENKFQHLINSDIFVFIPNKPEGHPWVIVEAMAAGLPIIATDQGAITESVIDGKNGYIVPVNDPLVVSEKLLQLIEDDKLRANMSKKSSLYYQEKFNEDALVKNYSAVFNIILEQNDKK